MRHANNSINYGHPAGGPDAQDRALHTSIVRPQPQVKQIGQGIVFITRLSQACAQGDS